MKTIVSAMTFTLLALAGQSATAAEHEVLILRYGFYPETTYVQPGNTIKFVNESPGWAKVQSNDPVDNYPSYTGNCDSNTFAGSSDGWTTDWIAKYSSETVTVLACSDTKIAPPSIDGYTTYTDYNNGWIVFGNAPTG